MDVFFRDQGVFRNCGGLHPLRGHQIRRGRNFGPICGYILQTVTDRGIFTIKDKYKLACALKNGTTFDDLE